MTEADERFAERLAGDLARVLGVGILVDDIELEVGDPSREARVRATLIAGTRTETIEAAGATLVDLYQPILQRAAGLRLRDAFWQMVGPA